MNRLIIVLVTFIFAFIALTQNPGGSVIADGGPNDECENAQATSIVGTQNLVSYTAPSGQIVSGVCIKSGSGMFGDSHSESLTNGTYEVSGTCYTVSGVGTQTVTVTRNFDANTCKGISHIDVYYGSQPTNTPTPTPTVTNTPTPTPTNTPTPTPGDECRNQDCEATPTPTPTVTVTNTPTPTQGTPNTGGPGDGRSDGLSDGRSDGRSSSPQKQGEVLGISTLPNTGNFASTIATIEEGIGAVIAATGILLYGKKSKKAKKSK